jgi:hypothetical protein
MTPREYGDYLLQCLQRLAAIIVALALFGLIATALFGHPRADAQAAIITHPTKWANVVTHVQVAPTRACIAGWERDTDRFGDWLLRRAFVDFGRLDLIQQAAIASAISAGDLAALAAMRTVPVTDTDPAMAPCMAKLIIPPPVWIVAPLTSGKRPAYLLNADKTRGAQSGTADTLIEGQQMPCDCKTRSVETTTSTYCDWMTRRLTFDAAEPVRVALCREAK